ncbi:hypothetical protein M426DRAFT_182263 [Hypoxylon sp. CI-4A]|nr:hypothetical protein M426DRAFT_182263 [Hypoxylon sp. CI-4A]
MPSKKTAPPTPLNLESSPRRQDSWASTSSSYSEKDKVGGLARCSAALAAALRSNRPQEEPRTNRYDEYLKSLASQPSPSRKHTHSSHGSSSKPHSPTVNVYTHCGRHTDQYLFGGWSNIVKSTFKKD